MGVETREQKDEQEKTVFSTVIRERDGRETVGVCWRRLLTVSKLNRSQQQIDTERKARE